MTAAESVLSIVDNYWQAREWLHIVQYRVDPRRAMLRRLNGVLKMDRART